MPIAIITGNRKKFEELAAFLPDAVQVPMDLPEIQSLSSEEIIAAKLHEARKHHAGPLLVDDVSFGIDALHGFPGPLIKWMLHAVGAQGIWELSRAIGDDRATVVCTLGYAQGDTTVFAKGVVHGRVVEPTSPHAFGWDGIFLPDGETRTYADMSREEKNAISHRAQAFAALRERMG